MRGPSASQASGRRLPGRNRSAGPHSKEFCSPEFQGGSMRFRTTILISVLLAATGLAHAAEETPLLANSPTVSKTQVVFAYGGSFLGGARGGGVAQQFPAGRRADGAGFLADGKASQISRPAKIQ